MWIQIHSEDSLKAEAQFAEAYRNKDADAINPNNVRFTLALAAGDEGAVECDECGIGLGVHSFMVGDSDVADFREFSAFVQDADSSAPWVSLTICEDCKAEIQ